MPTKKVGVAVPSDPRTKNGTQNGAKAVAHKGKWFTFAGQSPALRGTTLRSTRLRRVLFQRGQGADPECPAIPDSITLKLDAWPVVGVSCGACKVLG